MPKRGNALAFLVECYACGAEYPPVECRWRCPVCGAKDSCCDGEPQVQRFRPQHMKDLECDEHQ